MNNAWDGPRVNLTRETANEHYTPSARRTPAEPGMLVPRSVAVAAADAARVAKWAPVERDLRALIAQHDQGVGPAVELFPDCPKRPHHPLDCPGDYPEDHDPRMTLVRILAMEAGTTFTGDWGGVRVRAMRVVDPNEDYPLGYDAVGDDGMTYKADEFDPASIREVRVPPSE